MTKTKKQARDDEGEKKQKAVKVESKPKPKQKQKPKPIVAKPQKAKPQSNKPTRRLTDAEEYRHWINDPRTNGRLMAMLNDSDDDGDNEFETGDPKYDLENYFGIDFLYDAELRRVIASCIPPQVVIVISHSSFSFN